MSITAARGTVTTIGTMDTKDLAARLDAGEWLRPGEVAELLGVSRPTVVRMLNADPPLLRYRHKPGTGRHRECHPEDVRRLLTERRQVHGE